MPKDDETAPAGRTGRGLRIALAVSVALNLCVAGVVLGAFLRDPPRAPVALRDLGFGPFNGALTDEDRRSLRAAFVARGPDLRTARREMRSDMAAVSAALRADPFVPETLRAALDRGAARTLRLLTAGQDLLYDHVLSLTPAARAAMADRLDALQKRRGQGRHGDRAP